MTTDLATRSTTTVTTAPMTLPEKMKYAEALASANLLPRAYQQQPGNVLLAMEMGDAMGIPAIQAINDIHVIEGKPSASANLIGAMVRKAGHKLRVNGDDKSATAQVIRADDPDFTFEVTWTLDRAKTAGLLSGKGNWSKYPAAMLKARAITEVARSACPDALYGVVYTPEELGAVVTEEGTPVTNPNPAPVRQDPPAAQQPAPAQSAGAQQVRQAKARAQSRPAPSAASPAEAPAAGELATDEQWQSALANLGAQGITDGATQHQTVVDVIGRNIAHPNEMTPAEADKVRAWQAPTPAAESEPIQGELVDEQA